LTSKDKYFLIWPPKVWQVLAIKGIYLPRKHNTEKKGEKQIHGIGNPDIRRTKTIT
jgi:hypothetical protein